MKNKLDYHLCFECFNKELLAFLLRWIIISKDIQKVHKLKDGDWVLKLINKNIERKNKLVTQIINPARQAKKRIMKTWGLKSGKKYRKWVKKERRRNKCITKII